MADESRKKRVAAFTIAIARALDSSVQETRSMARGAYLHDCDSDSIPFPDAAEIVAAQHESYDGTGFPKALKGDEIPLGARILRVADALDALLTGRPPLGGNVIRWINTEKRHHRAVSILEAREEIQHASGALFDPKVVNAFLGIPDGVWADLIQEISKND